MDIDKIVKTLNTRAVIYNRYAYVLLMASWLIWLLVTLIGIVLTTTGLAINNKLVTTILGAVVTALGLLQTKFKPTKRGCLYKSSALAVRKLSRSAQKLKGANLPQQEIDSRLENIMDALEDIELSLYDYGTEFNEVEEVVVE